MRDSAKPYLEDEIEDEMKMKRDEMGPSAIRPSLRLDGAQAASFP